MIRKLMRVAILLLSVTPYVILAGNSYLNGPAVIASATISFTNTAQWSTGVPGLADDAYFTNAVTPLNVTFPYYTTNADAVFNQTGAGTVNIKVASGGQTWCLTNTLIAGQTAGATPTVQINAAMRVVVTNANNSGTEIIGASGSGTLGVLASATNVANQIVLGQNTGSTGTLSLAGGLCAVSNAAGTGWVQVGSNGVGAVTLSGGALTADGWSVGTTNPGSAGTVTWSAGSKVTIGGVTDTVTIVTNLLGTSWGYNLCQSLVLNTNIPGVMSYPNGFTLGETAAGNGSLALNGGTFVATNAGGNATLRVGVSGVGNLTFGGVAKVTLDSLALATNVGSQASLTWNPGAMVTIGGNADPAANIANLLGASFGRTSKQTLTLNTNVLVKLPGGLLFGETATGTGLVNIAAGTLAFTNATGTGTSPTWGPGGGTLDLAGGTLIADHLNVTNDTNNTRLVLDNGALVLTGDAILTNMTGADSYLCNVGACALTVMGGTVNLSASSNKNLWFSKPLSVTVANGSTLVMNALTVYDDHNSGFPTNLVTGSGSRWVINGALTIGNNAAGWDSWTTVTNGGQLVVSGLLTIDGRRNRHRMDIAGARSTLNAGLLYVGGGNTSSGGGSNNLFVTGGAVCIVTNTLTVGYNTDASDNVLTIDGASLLVTNAARNAIAYVGYFGMRNTLVLTNGGTALLTGSAIIGNHDARYSNQVVVTGSSTRWDMTGDLTVGNKGTNGTITTASLTVANGAVLAASNVNMSVGSTSTITKAYLAGGNLYVTNTLTVGQLGPATFTLNGGLVSADRLIVTNVFSALLFNAGTLCFRNSTVSNGLAFVVGDGTDAATLNLMGGTAHRFANGLFVNTNATLLANNTGVIGSAVVTGNVTLAQGSVLNLDVTATNRDTIAVIGTLTLPTQATVTVNTLDGSTPWNITNVLSATSLAGATDISGWTVSGRYYARTVGNAVVLTQKTRGTTLMFR